MKKKIIKFKPGTITLYDKEVDIEFGGSLFLKNQESPVAEKYEEEQANEDINKESFLKSVDSHLAKINDNNNQDAFNSTMVSLPEPASKNIFKRYLELLDFSLLFNFLKAKSKVLIEKLFYSEKVTRVKPVLKLPSGSLAIIFLLISFLSLSSILLPLVVGKINSLNQQARAEEIQKTNQKLEEERAAQVKLYEIDPTKELAISKDYKLFIPKIGLESDISPSVDLDSEEDYKKQLLTTGVAHAKGSYFPGQSGSVFLFAHSTDTVFNIAQFNAKFFSLGELQNGDVIQVTYQGKDFKYSVVDKQIIEPDQVDLVRNSGNALILMTCTPPGTDWQRLIIFAEEQAI